MQIYFKAIASIILLFTAASLLQKPLGEWINITSSSSKFLKAQLGGQYCPEPSYRSDALVEEMIRKMKEQSFESQMLKVLTTEVPKDSHVFSSAQYVRIINSISFDNSKRLAAEVMNPYVVSLTTDEILTILKTVSFSDSRLFLLQSLADTLNDASEENKRRLIDKGFTFSSEKEKASQILKDVKQRNCIFGTVKEKVATFIIDISPSMGQSFKTSDGKTFSRLEFVKQQLIQTISDQLREYQKFNVIAFGQSQSVWSNENVNANKANIDSALRWIKGLGQISATNLSGALQRAFNSKENLEAIYMLSDGYPNSGFTTLPDMEKFLRTLNTQRINNSFSSVKVHTTSFMLGGVETDKERILGQQFMELIASVTGGSFKAMGNN